MTGRPAPVFPPPPTAAGPDPLAGPAERPLLPRLLRLRHLSLRGWQRVLLGDAPFVVAVLLVLADLATAWTLLVLPLAVAAMVKFHDTLAGALGRLPRVLPPA